MTNIKTLIIAATLACTFAPAITMCAMDENNQLESELESAAAVPASAEVYPALTPEHPTLRLRFPRDLALLPTSEQPSLNSDLRLSQATVVDDGEDDIYGDFVAPISIASAASSPAAELSPSPQEIQRSSEDLLYIARNHSNVPEALQSAQILLDANAQVEFRDEAIHRDTPLLAATRAIKPSLPRSYDSGVPLIQMLLSHGAPIESTTILGDTPLALAVNNEHAQLVATLLNLKADINTKNRFKKSPLLNLIDRIARDFDAKRPISFVHAPRHLARMSPLMQSQCIHSMNPTVLIKKNLMTIAQILIFADAQMPITTKNMSYAQLQIHSSINEIYATYQDILEQLNTLKIMLQKDTILNDHLPIEALAKLSIEYAIPYFNEPHKRSKLAYDFLNERIAQKWEQIKIELEQARLSNK